MRLVCFATILCLVGCCATSAWAQYGLYGSPEVLRVPQTAAMYQPEPAQTTPAPPVPSAAGVDPSATRPGLQPSNGVATQSPPVANQPVAGSNGYGGSACYGCDTGCQAIRGDACNLGAECDTCCPWYASVSAIVLGRMEGRRLWTSYADQHNVDQLTNTQDIHLPWSWGGEVSLGRRYCCGCDTWAIEGTFWTTEPMNGFCSTINSTISPYRVSTPLALNDLFFDGTGSNVWFDGAGEHRLWRHDEFYDCEINFIRVQTACGCYSPWEIGWSAGVRYFRFDERLKFGSLMYGATWGEDGGIYEAYLDDRITNNLIGGQIGLDLAYRVGENVRCFFSPTFGVFNNNMDQNFQAHLGDGTVGDTPYGPFPVHSTRNGLAFLWQVDLGLDWQFSNNWSAQIGYRVLGINGAALADDQFPQYVVDLPEIRHIDNHASLVLHGAFAGLTYNF